jgi:hypothetical protein
MNRVKYAGALALAAALMTAGTASAQQPQPCAMMKDHQMGGMRQSGPGTMKQDHQMGGMQQQGMSGMGMGMMEMCQKMQEGTAQECRMMEGMKGERQPMVEMKKHLREMKKHMNMLDEMMDGMMDKMMMQRRQGMTPSGSESEPQEHHPGESK